MAAAIHGDKSQNARQTALNNFKAGTIRVLVATDIAARGIDIEELSCVINFDLPNIPETYVHRIGRTGRAGMGGRAISFSNIEEKAYVKDIEKLTGKKIPVVEDHPFPMTVFTIVPKETKPRPGRGREQNPQQAKKSSKKAASGLPVNVLKKTAASTPINVLKKAAAKTPKQPSETPSPDSKRGSKPGGSKAPYKKWRAKTNGQTAKRS